MGRVYAVVSAKGGVGKTTTAANLAAALAAAGSRVAVVDGDLGMANLASALGVEVGEVTLHDVLAGDGDVAAAIHEGPHGLSVVPGSPALDAFSRADPERLESVLGELSADHDYVILDTGAGLSNDTVVPLTYVDEILLVSTPTRDALRDTDKTRRVAERLGATVAGAALLRADPSAAESDVVVETLDVGVLGTVPDAEVIRRAAEADEPLTTFAPGSPAAAAFASLAAGLTGEHVAAPTTDDADAAEGADESADDTAASPAVGSDEDSDGDGDDVSDEDSDDDPADDSVATATEAPDAGPDTGGESVDETGDEAESVAGTDVDESDDESDVGEPEADDDESDGETEIEEPEADDDEPDVEIDQEPDAEEVDDRTPEPADTPDETDATDPDSQTGSEDPVVEAVDDESPVGPADPDAVATAGDPSDDEGGVYTTPLEEVPIDEAEAAGSEDSADADTEEAAADVDDIGGSDSDEETDPADDEDDDSGGGFFSRFFG